MQGIKILVVDDNLMFAESAKRFLQSCEGVAAVDIALSGEEALTQVSKARPDLVVTDLKMPSMNGLELTRRIKAIALPPKVVIVSLTLEESFEHQGTPSHGGADAYLSKQTYGLELQALLTQFFNPSSTTGQD